MTSSIKTFGGDARHFALINTTEYNEDGKFAITLAGIRDLPELGVDGEDIVPIDHLEVSESYTIEKGAIIIRVA